MNERDAIIKERLTRQRIRKERETNRNGTERVSTIDATKTGMDTYIDPNHEKPDKEHHAKSKEENDTNKNGDDCTDTNKNGNVSIANRTEKNMVQTKTNERELSTTKKRMKRRRVNDMSDDDCSDLPFGWSRVPIRISRGMLYT